MHQRHQRLSRLPRVLHAIWAPALAAALALSALSPTPGTERPSVAGTDHQRLSLVSSAPVKPVVHEFPVAVLSRSHGRALAALAGTPAGSRLLALSTPETVNGFATVGVTWAHGESPSASALTISVRTEKNGVWSQWQPMPYEPGHAPDPNSAEGRHALPGTDAVVIGDQDAVQIKMETRGPTVDHVNLAVINPGKQIHSVLAQPAINTAALDARDGVSLASDQPGTTPEPQIFSRAQWGADESIREKSSLHYYEVHAGFVHHTVNANGYTRAQVPSIIRGIYAYHVESRGWSDIGYNFLIDRFGRIWEGRYGGVDRPVVGAHTLGYNSYAFGASAIGNYQQVKPSRAMIHAFAALFAWKLSLHGVDAASTHQLVGDTYFQAINGHRDANQTECPGQYLYNRLPRIRVLASRDQHSWASRQRQTDLTGDGWPDIVARSTSDQQMYILPTAGQQSYLAPVQALSGLQNRDLVATVGDITGDGIPDLLARDASTKVTDVFPGTANGGFGSSVRQLGRFKYVNMMFGVGDWNHDGYNDVIGRNGGGRLVLFPGLANGRFGKPRRLVNDASMFTRFVGTGNFAAGRQADIVMADGSGTLWVLPRYRDTIRPPVKLPGDWSSYDLLVANPDLTGDGLPDILAGDSSTGQVTLFPWNGSRSFGHPMGPFDFAQNATNLLVAGSLTGPGKHDLVTFDSAGNVSVVADAGTRNVLPAIPTGVDVSWANTLLNVGDFNGDGFGDVLVRGAGGWLWLLPGKGNGTFGDKILVSKRFKDVGKLAAVGDMTGDGVPDLMGQPQNGAMRIYPGNGTGGLARSYVAHDAIAGNRQIGFGLFDADGAPDSLIRRKGKLFEYAGNGPGGLITGGAVLDGAGQYNWLLGSGDINGDGYADLLVRDSATGSLWYLPGSSSGLGAPVFISSGASGYDLAG